MACASADLMAALPPLPCRLDTLEMVIEGGSPEYRGLSYQAGRRERFSGEPVEYHSAAGAHRLVALGLRRVAAGAGTGVEGGPEPGQAVSEQ
jgi:hypothetical protein